VATSGRAVTAPRRAAPRCPFVARWRTLDTEHCPGTNSRIRIKITLRARRGEAARRAGWHQLISHSARSAILRRFGFPIREPWDYGRFETEVEFSMGSSPLIRAASKGLKCRSAGRMRRPAIVSAIGLSAWGIVFRDRDSNRRC